MKHINIYIANAYYIYRGTCTLNHLLTNNITIFANCFVLFSVKLKTMFSIVVIK